MKKLLLVFTMLTMSICLQAQTPWLKTTNALSNRIDTLERYQRNVSDTINIAYSATPNMVSKRRASILYVNSDSTRKSLTSMSNLLSN